MTMEADEQNKLMAIIRDALQKLDEAVENATAVCEPMVEAAKDADLTTQIFMYFSMKMIRTQLENADKIMNKGMPIAAERASKIMMAQFMDEVRMFGYIFKPDKKTYYDVKEENRPSMVAWMKMHPVGKEFVKETVHPATFAKFMQEEFTDKGNDCPTFVSTFKKDQLEVRKIRGS